MVSHHCWNPDKNVPPLIWPGDQFGTQVLQIFWTEHGILMQEELPIFPDIWLKKTHTLENKCLRIQKKIFKYRHPPKNDYFLDLLCFSLRIKSVFWDKF